MKYFLFLLIGSFIQSSFAFAADPDVSQNKDVANCCDKNAKPNSDQNMENVQVIKTEIVATEAAKAPKMKDASGSMRGVSMSKIQAATAHQAAACREVADFLIWKYRGHGKGKGKYSGKKGSGKRAGKGSRHHSKRSKSSTHKKKRKH